MKKKLTWLIVLALLLAGLSAFAIFDEEITGFLFPVRNDWAEKDGVLYYHDEDGDPVTGWFLYEGNSYYLDPFQGGAMHTGWLELDGSRYCLNEQGHLLTGWQEIGGTSYYFNENGAMHTGWLDLDGKEYYLTDTGMVTTGLLELDGGRYYFDESGVRVTGMVAHNGVRYFLNPDGSAAAGWVESDGASFYILEDGTVATGKLELEDGIWYLDETGAPLSGWQDIDAKRCYLDETGKLVTGWLKLEDTTYYLKEDGTMAVGRVVIDDVARYFTSTGAYIVMVNRWNPVPEDYKANPVAFEDWQVDASCYDALTKMLSDCPYEYTITSAYRTQEGQQAIWDNRLATHQANGYSYSDALALTEAYVAVPGTSEHQLGLAVDISGEDAQKWLEEHCWEYGFILRYLDGKSDITGISYEKWHFRYVGTELAMELKGTGLCLEEYLDNLTTDGGTASNPDRTAVSAVTADAA